MMTDNEIIKALECCLDISPSTCKNCSLFNVTNSTMVCSKIATKFALDLINCQKAEIERLQGHNENLQTANTALSNEILDIKTEAVKLKEKVSEDKVQWLKQGECPMTPEQFNAIYDDEETVGEDK